MPASPSRVTRFRSYDGARLACRVEGTGRPLLLAAGLARRAQAWRDQYAHLASRYAWLSWDYRGLGDNRQLGVPEVTSATDHARDALSLLDAAGVDQTAVVASSFGTQVALELYRLAPERVAALVLVGPAPVSPWRGRPVAGPLTERYLRARGPVIAELESLGKRLLRWPEVQLWARRLGWVGDTIDAEAWRGALEAMSRESPEAVRPFLRAMDAFDGTAVLPRIDVPTLVVALDRDFMSAREGAELVASRVRGAELLTIPGASHFVHAEFPELLSLRMEKFFRERGYSDARDSRRPSAPP